MGITKTVAKVQYFTTLDDAEFKKLGGSYREYILPRDNALSKVKGWIRGNTKIGPALKVAVSHHQGRHGIEIMTESLFGDGTCSFVMIVNEINKYVTEITEETQEHHIDNIGERYRNPVAKQNRNKHQYRRLLFQRLRYHITSVSGSTSNQVRTTRVVSKCQKRIRLLRHDPSVFGEEGGAVQFRTLAPMFRSEFTSSQYWSIRTWLNY